MAQVTRRFFITSSAALSIGCATRLTAAAAPSTTATRQPVVGQSWRYSKHDLFSRVLVESQLDRVTAVGANVQIDSSSEPPKDESAANPNWGTEVLQKYVVRREKPVTGALPSEIQDPWGMILADPHWAQVQVYEAPIPLWPEQLRPGWHTHIKTKYKTPANRDALTWNQTMKAHAWETVSVPAGRFNTLRFTNMIDFISTDITRTDCARQETLWFAPEVGRWVARESAGSYFQDDSAVDTPYSESSYRWELLEWS
jgi:hypothetical protein